GRRYQYNRAGELLTLHDSLAGPTRYHYDPAGRLLQANDERFNFDPAGNPFRSEDYWRPEQHGLRLADNRVLSHQGKRYHYDPFGNLIEKQQPGQIQRYRYDAEHRLVEVEIETAQGKRRLHYRYDAFGRRVEKREGSRRTTFSWDGDRLAEETKAGQTTSWLYEPDSFIALAQLSGPTPKPQPAPKLDTIQLDPTQRKILQALPLEQRAQAR
ncbi:RHS repeat protein, partial [Chitinimonas sp. DQS-5]|nr:RHS repeat protein [Parachitinimonas caeni]